MGIADVEETSGCVDAGEHAFEVMGIEAGQCNAAHLRANELGRVRNAFERRGGQDQGFARDEAGLRSHAQNFAGAAPQSDVFRLDAVQGGDRGAKIFDVVARITIDIGNCFVECGLGFFGGTRKHFHCDSDGRAGWRNLRWRLQDSQGKARRPWPRLPHRIAGTIAFDEWAWILFSLSCTRTRGTRRNLNLPRGRSPRKSGRRSLEHSRRSSLHHKGQEHRMSQIS